MYDLHKKSSDTVVSIKCIAMTCLTMFYISITSLYYMCKVVGSSYNCKQSNPVHIDWGCYKDDIYIHTKRYQVKIDPTVRIPENWALSIVMVSKETLVPP